MSSSLLKRLWFYASPMQMLAIAIFGFLLTIFHAIVTLDVATLTNISRLRDGGFSQLFRMIGKNMKEFEEEAKVPDLVARASGKCLEIGPGTGNQVSRYDVSKLSQIFGVEPNLALHPQLRDEIKKSKLEDLYTIVPHGVEERTALNKLGIEDGSMDTVLSVQVLCSVPNPEETAKDLYRLLRPGGQLLVWEHVQSVDPVTRLMQSMYGLIWAFFLGDCHMNRNTRQYLIDAGQWEEIDLQKEGELVSLFPRIRGRLVKAR